MTAGSVAAPRIIPLRAPGRGRAKHEVDTATPVEVKSDSTDVQIYYTLDGSSPEAWRTARGGESSTMRYSRALLLPPGKVSLRAVAVTSDGRQSATVTKVFLVSLNEAMLRDQEDGQEKEVGKETLQSTGSSTPSRSALQHPAGTLTLSAGGARFLSGRLGPQDSKTQKSSSPQEPPRPKTLQTKLSHPQSTRVQREADFLRCTRCLCDRPSDPFSRFCIHCGASLPPVPGQRLPPTEAGQMAVCVVCNTLVPVNTPTCLICEAAIAPQLRPQASLKLQDKALCVVCGSVNPGHISHCVTCESRLTPSTWAAAPPLPPAKDQRVACSKCHRINNQDARYCDWCGSKPSHPVSSVLCGGCGASSHPYASYCSACGLIVTWRPLLSTDSSHSTSQATPTRTRAQPTADRQTQTVGLFYPSSAELNKTQQQRALGEQAERRRPLLTAVSPGRGYWRKQVDHVCAHLRSYAQNNPHCRTLLGEPRMGRMVSAVIKEDEYEVSLRLNFQLLEPDAQVTQVTQVSLSVSLSVCLSDLSVRHPGQFVILVVLVSRERSAQTLSSVTEGRNPTSNTTSLGRTQPAARQKPSLQTTQKPLDGLLLEEAGLGGRGSVVVVQQLLDQVTNTLSHPL
ncbi:Double zinc ribbon and ankyrin repeat-containing protein 1 [Merluccius polli]|uniref:Double zinc ribbon and ankyrin repeat-containing protein 1 n=1 Tax=Merluccius polli TaxID=89951 RepID=A0AA47NXL0_MERPO|nr:Double zinc ribbon and ankyrin repeat-containing protein 1 [Merluccius polli]